MTARRMIEGQDIACYWSSGRSGGDKRESAVVLEHLTEELHLVLLGKIKGEGGHLTTDSVVERERLQVEARKRNRPGREI